MSTLPCVFPNDLPEDGPVIRVQIAKWGAISVGTPPVNEHRPSTIWKLASSELEGRQKLAKSFVIKWCLDDFPFRYAEKSLFLNVVPSSTMAEYHFDMGT
jgi:hypothetical protein